MMPPADRIQLEQDPGHVASKKGQDERPKDFQAVGPALRILQLDQYLRFVSIQASRFQQARRQTQRRCGVSTAWAKNIPPPEGSWHFSFFSQTVENF